MAFWKKIFKSKYTGAEIDAAVAKAVTVPAVTSADAGKALVVDEEGKIVAGEAGTNIPEFQFTAEEFTELSASFGLFLYGLTAAAGLVSKDFTISTNAAGCIARLKELVATGSPFVAYKVDASYGGYSILSTAGDKGFSSNFISMYIQALTKRVLLAFDVGYDNEETYVTVTVSAQVITAAA